MSDQPSQPGEDSGQPAAPPTLGDVVRARVREVYETYGPHPGDDPADHITAAAELLIIDAIDECQQHGLTDDCWLVSLARLGANIMVANELGWRLPR
jgi:hypothetical protein